MGLGEGGYGAGLGGTEVRGAGTGRGLGSAMGEGPASGRNRAERRGQARAEPRSRGGYGAGPRRTLVVRACPVQRRLTEALCAAAVGSRVLAEVWLAWWPHLPSG